MPFFNKKKPTQYIPDEPIVREDLAKELKEDQLPDRIEGVIYFINYEKGYGFIESKELRFERIYFNWKYLNGDTKRFQELEKRDKVEFTPIEVIEEDENRGWKAVKIRVLDGK